MPCVLYIFPDQMVESPPSRQRYIPCYSSECVEGRVRANCFLASCVFFWSFSIWFLGCSCCLLFPSDASSVAFLMPPPPRSLTNALLEHPRQLSNASGIVSTSSPSAPRSHESKICIYKNKIARLPSTAWVIMQVSRRLLTP